MDIASNAQVEKQNHVCLGECHMSEAKDISVLRAKLCDSGSTLSMFCRVLELESLTIKLSAWVLTMRRDSLGAGIGRAMIGWIPIIWWFEVSCLLLCS